MSPKAERRSVSFGLIAFVVVGVSIVGLILFSLASRPVVTLREFDQLAVGMTPEECERIIGSEGKRNMSMQSTLPGFSTSGEDRQWVNADDSYAGVVFMNGKLQTKLQVGLK